MSFSLYGALPPSKSDKAVADSTKKEASSSQLSSLYSSLPAPESGSTVFKSNSQQPSSESTTKAAAATAATTTTASTANAPPPTKPAGWSAINTFRPVLRRPTIQAKPKLNKPFIPAGATIVSTKTITKEDREKELQMEFEAKKASLEEQKKNDNIDLGAIPLLTTADDVNGFRATQKANKKKKKGSKAAANAPPQPVVFNMLEDYDPHRPNDYEQYKEERRELKEQQKRKREWEKKQDVDRSRSPSRSRSNSRSRSPTASPQRHAPVDSTTVKINVNETAEDAYMRRLKMSQQHQPQPSSIPEPPRTEELHPAQAIAQHLAANITKEIPSQVILLTNMVGPGEVDDMLQEETAEECSKYGKVERCLIFEVPKGKISDDRAVRIFVQFSSVDSARNAIQDLDGRFFGGRIVSATFFDMKRFERLDLAPSKEEWRRVAAPF